MTREESSIYCRENKDAMRFADIAANDYIACRCCMVNYLPMGAVLGSQCVEKIIKSTLFLLRNDTTEVKLKKFMHGIWPMIECYQENLIVVYPDILKYERTIKKLDEFYKNRYEWNVGMELPNDLFLIDELFLYLLVNSPMPDEVKFRSGFLVRIFDDHILNHASIHWSMLNNNAFMLQYGVLKNKYDLVMKNLYGK